MFLRQPGLQATSPVYPPKTSSAQKPRADISFVPDFAGDVGGRLCTQPTARPQIHAQLGSETLSPPTSAPSLLALNVELAPASQHPQESSLSDLEAHRGVAQQRWVLSLKTYISCLKKKVNIFHVS